MARVQTNPERDASVKHIATRIVGFVDDLKRQACPQCGHENLQPRLGPNSVAVVCTTPLYRDCEFEGEFEPCGYYKLVHATDINSGVFALEFKEPTPKPKPRRAAPPR